MTLDQSVLLWRCWGLWNCSFSEHATNSNRWWLLRDGVVLHHSKTALWRLWMDFVSNLEFSSEMGDKSSNYLNFTDSDSLHPSSWVAILLTRTNCSDVAQNILFRAHRVCPSLLCCPRPATRALGFGLCEPQNVLQKHPEATFCQTRSSHWKIALENSSWVLLQAHGCFWGPWRPIEWVVGSVLPRRDFWRLPVSHSS